MNLVETKLNYDNFWLVMTMNNMMFVGENSNSPNSSITILNNFYMTNPVQLQMTGPGKLNLNPGLFPCEAMLLNAAFAIKIDFLDKPFADMLKKTLDQYYVQRRSGLIVQ
jgi:hypothetical protein